jgi:hypothetical protein
MHGSGPHRQNRLQQNRIFDGWRARDDRHTRSCQAVLWNATISFRAFGLPRCLYISYRYVKGTTQVGPTDKTACNKTVYSMAGEARDDRHTRSCQAVLWNATISFRALGLPRCLYISYRYVKGTTHLN